MKHVFLRNSEGKLVNLLIVYLFNDSQNLKCYNACRKLFCDF